MRVLTRRRVLVLLLGLAAVFALFLGIKWKSVSDHGGQKPAEACRIAGDFYYVVTTPRTRAAPREAKAPAAPIRFMACTGGGAQAAVLEVRGRPLILPA